MYDFIIVGAGSAGSVLAERLSANGRERVLVLEAGGSDLSPWVHIPIGYGKAFYHKKLNWMYRTQAVDGLKGRQIYWPRGKVLGGSSSINAMVYIRGQREDFDEWAALGNPGWGWADVLNYFRMSERCAGGMDDGCRGPLHISDVSARTHPLCRNFICAAEECGVPFNPDFNGERQEGAGYYQNTIKDGLRMSCARAWLWPARRRKNVTVMTQTQVMKILFEQKKAVGVSCAHKGQMLTYHARKEVILCAGAINSPQLLMLSGVGAGQQIQGVGLRVVHESPAVGRNLQDHLSIDYVFRARVATLNQQLGPWWGKLWFGLMYLLTRRGPLSLGLNQAGGFVRTNGRVSKPNMQIFFSPVSYTKAPPGKRPLLAPDPFPGYLLSAQPTRPRSSGDLVLASPDPFADPVIRPNYLSDPFDLAEMLEGAHYIRTLAQAPALASVTECELLPGSAARGEEALIDDIRGRSTTVFHPVRTCRMGPDPKTSVVNARLQVYGLERLRVVDASVFPTLTSGNTNAPVIMVAQKAADMILDDNKG